MLKPTYPEGDLVRVADLFWRRYDYDPPITEMDHRIDQVSEKIIKEYIDDGHLVNIDNDDRHHLKYARKHQYFAKKGRMVKYPVCDKPDSHGYRWRLVSNI